jgi:hypothetical protein
MPPTTAPKMTEAHLMNTQSDILTGE